MGGTAAGRLGWPSDGGGRTGAGLRRREDKGRGESGPAAGPPGSGAGSGARSAWRGWAWVFLRPAPAQEAP